MRHRLARSAALVVAAAAAVLLGAHAIGAQETASVDVQDNEFVEPEIVVTEGGTVEWKQSGSNPHSVTADDGSFDSHPDCFPVCMGEGDSFSHTFDTPGEYPYYCKVHGAPGGEGMSGIVRVQAAQEETTTTTTTSTTTEQPVTSTTESSPTSTTSAPPTDGDTQTTPETAESTGTLPNTGVPVSALLLVGAGVAVLGVFGTRLGRRAG